MRTILITGASGGLAQSLVSLLPDDQLLLVGRDAKRLYTLYEEHCQKAIFELDITDAVAVEELVNQLYDQYETIDILVNNAGYALYKEFEDFSQKEVADMFAVNTFSLMTFCRLVGQRMKQARYGHIINIVSMSGFIASAKSSVYSASKFAAIGFSNTIRLELAPYRVAVTTVNPGPIETPFFETADPDGDYLKSVSWLLLQPEEVAKQIVAAMKTKKREVNLPRLLVFAHKGYTLFPRLADFLARTVFHYK